MKSTILLVSCIYSFLPTQAWLLSPSLRLPHDNRHHCHSSTTRPDGRSLYHVHIDCQRSHVYKSSSRHVLQATAKDLSPVAAKGKAAPQESSSSDPFVVVKAFTNLFPKDNTTIPKESRKDDGGFSFPRISLFAKSQEEDNKETPAKESSSSSKTSFFRNLWNRTKNDSNNETISRDEAERQRRDKESERVRKYKQEKQEQKRLQQQAKQQAKQKTDKQTIDSDQDASSSFAWPLAMLSKVQSSAMGLFNSTSSSGNATINNTSSNSSNPFSTVQKFWASSASLISSATTSITSGGGNSNKEEWITVFPKTRLMPGVIVPVTIAGGLDLLVVASKDGRRLYAIENSCPHLGTPLETGQLVRLPVEESPPPTIAAAGSRGSSKGPFSAQQQSSSSSSDASSFQSKLTGAFNGPWSESDVSKILQQDGCEDCIVCPLHRTAFALQSGNVRGEWCPYPPILGKLIGNVKAPTGVAVFDVRTRGKNVEIRINTPILMDDDGV